jgi:D-alanine-D-alanine ligase
MKLRAIACVIDDDIIDCVSRGETSESDKRMAFDISVVRRLRRLADVVHLVPGVEGKGTIEELARLQPEVVFNLAFSACPLEPSFAGALEVLGLPYTGSGSSSIALANDKIRSRHLLRTAGIRVPRFAELAPRRRPKTLDFDPPFIVKPVSSGDSEGIRGDSVVDSYAQALKRADRLWRELEMHAVCDEFIVGREFQVGLVEARRWAFYITEIVELHFDSARPGRGFKTELLMKWGKPCRLYETHARRALLPRRLKTRMAEIARKTANVLDLRGYAKIDLRMDDEENIIIIEANSNPGLLSTNKIWGTPGFEINLRRIINAALRRARE